MTASILIRREIARRDLAIGETDSRQRLVILSAERRALVLALDIIEMEHAATHVRVLTEAKNRRNRSTSYMSTSLRLCAALREREAD
jgi:hypothetical protein